MSIIDTQVHIWAADTPERPWPEYGRGMRIGLRPSGRMSYDNFEYCIRHSAPLTCN
jgi:hypothetical protein